MERRGTPWNGGEKKEVATTAVQDRTYSTKLILIQYKIFYALLCCSISTGCTSLPIVNSSQTNDMMMI